MMPKPNYKSITVADSVYARFMKEWEIHEDKLREIGITNFTGFFIWCSFKGLDLAKREYLDDKGVQGA